MADLNRLAAAAQNFIDNVPDYWHRNAWHTTDLNVILDNLQFATPRELTWAANANEASLRARAARLPYRNVPEVAYTINPFWYHHSVIQP